MRARRACCLFLLLLVSPSFGQAADADPYSRRHTFAFFTDYSNDSSHMLMGRAENRKWFEGGFQYEYRLLDKPSLSWRYTAEFRPFAWESDPLERITNEVILPPPPSTNSYVTVPIVSCIPGTITVTETATNGTVYEGSSTTTCVGRRWTYVSGFSPFGTRLNLRPHKRLQPTANLTAGLLMSAKPIPYGTAGSFNFTFEIGAGLEYYLRSHRSVRLEWMYQHFSNAYTATANPGVDNGLFKLTYAFGH